jgi:hypothetical protein|tara:strand:+ start:949 stop:2052 length:1104 start_codon:yes stop_codon:yes gene_type:complete
MENMVDKKPLLEILIPTFNRSHSAQEAIENILACNDERLTVRCNSNGFEPALEKYRNLEPRVYYDSFESNRGFQENLHKLLAETNAKFCMILSDEDRVDVNEYKKILSFLENLSSSISVVISSISYKEKSGFYWRPNQRFSEIDIHDCVALNPMPTYVSGYIFCVDALRDIDLKSFFNSSIGNVYHFTDVSLYLLPQSKLKFYHDRFVEMSPEIKYGGDGHSHKLPDLETNDAKNLDLNPTIYGPKARARQFFYRENLLHKLKDNVGYVSLFIGKLNYVEFFYESIMDSENKVIFSQNMILKDEALSGIHDSKENKEYSGSLTARFFEMLLQYPRYISYLIMIIVSTFNRFFRKIYILHLIYNKNKK